VTKQDPALSQEDVREDVKEVVADPQATESKAETEEKSEGPGEGAPQEEPKTETAEEFELVVNGEAPSAQPKKTPDVVTEARKVFDENRALKAELAEVKRKLEAPASQATDPGPEPQPEDSNYDWTAYNAKRDAWKEAKRQQEEAQAKSQARAQSRIDAFVEGQAELLAQVPTYESARAAAVKLLGLNRVGAVINAVGKGAAKVLLAIGERPELANGLVSEDDPVLFGAAVARLEANVKVQKKPQVPPPARPVREGGPPAGADSELERLRAQVPKNGGDRTAIANHLREKRRAER
jgi:hypothetical protein